jgi:RimJ/RimL family protein N-acetyltransferase
MSLVILEAPHVSLISPFPMKEAHRIIRWQRCYRSSITEPNTVEEITHALSAPAVHTFGIVDREGALGIRHELPLVGVLAYTQDTPVNVAIDVACTRKAFGSRLADNAVQLLVGQVFAAHPSIARVTMTMEGSNAPMKALARRVGLHYEGYIKHSVVIRGELKDVAIYGICREEWTNQRLAEVVIDLVPRETQRYPDVRLEKLIDESVARSEVGSNI